MMMTTMMTEDFVDRIHDRIEALLNQQSFDATLEEACVLYVCNEVCRILCRIYRYAKPGVMIMTNGSL